MGHSNSFSGNEIERLIAGPTLPLLWEKLCSPWCDDWWQVEDEDAFEAAYIEREKVIAELEKVVLETCDTAYDEILEGAGARGALRDELCEGRVIALFDGLSLREACFLTSRLQELGRNPEMRFSFSALPSNTQAFCQKHFGVDSFAAFQDRTIHNFPAVYCPDENAINLPRVAAALLAVGLPDPLLHRARRGRTQIVSLKSAYVRTWTAMEKILEAASGKEVWVTTDHGYIYTGRNYNDLWWSLGNSAIGRRLAELFGGGRVVEISKITEEQRKEWRDYVICSGKQCFVKGRWLWPRGGAGEGVVHEGLSLIECLVPLLRIPRA